MSFDLDDLHEERCNRQFVKQADPKSLLCYSENTRRLSDIGQYGVRPTVSVQVTQEQPAIPKLEINEPF